MNGKFLTLCLGALLLFSCDNNTKKTSKLYEVEGKGGSVAYRVKYISADSTDLKPAIDSLVKVVDHSISSYNKESIVAKINQGLVATKANDHFKRAFATAQKVWKESGGFYDPTVGILVNAWGFGKELIQPVSKLPTEHEIDSLKKYVGFEKVHISDDDYVKKQNPAIQLDLTSVLRGYTADVISDFLKSKGIENFSVKVDGQTIVEGKDVVNNTPWKVEAEDPYELNDDYKEVILHLNNESVSTDENYRRVWIDGNGKRFVHIINPFTGYPMTGEMLSATVIAKTAVESDAYSTMFMIIGLEKSKEFLAKHPELKALLVYSDQNNEVKTYKTQNIEPLIVTIAQN
ncbi:FAD:protein FMN transferase [Capnocytophaga sputigena]|jgi:ApbE family protein|uniref:FAD:protein FMN transferase n=1 Tax=Capnocytophaga sputigena TaxID=1019 RepID=UPI000BB1D9FF|nr:FAD:protein FMN transferase [Capnocytophaga sputigena]ATA69803.1 ApbE family protein [Capnocytophaga sputigena]VEI52914.1 Thiamine biosynthesis lipoprotein ApbE precursor [Capnocytophaga sputigena]